MPRQRIILLITGFVLAAIAVVMVNIYLARQRNTIRVDEEKRAKEYLSSQTTVLVAKRDLPQGYIIDADSAEPKIVPRQFLQPNAVTAMDRISGMMVVAPIAQGEQITQSKLTQEKTKYGLSAMTPAGKRAITISVDNIASLVGMVKPGDYVDVIANLNVPMVTQAGQQTNQPAVVPLFQNVLVLAVGQDLGTTAQGAPRYAGGGAGESPLITLALGPQEANLIAFIQEQGRIRLVLRSHADAQVEQMQPANWDTLFQHLSPNKGKEGEQMGYVEIYHGLNKERVPLTQ